MATRTHRRRAAALVVAAVTLVAACGSDDGGGSTESTVAATVPATQSTVAAPDSSDVTTDSTTEVSSGADEGALGTPNKAEGEPVKVGLITELGSGAIDAQSQQTLDGAHAAVQYVNEYLGGIGGRPMELVECGNQGTPAGGQACANQMVEEGVVAVILPFTAQSEAQVPIITGAGIPYIIGAGTTQTDFTTPGVFSVSGGYVGTLGAVAQHASETGVTKLAHIVIDVPTAVAAAQQIGGLVFGNAGVGYEVITVPPGTPDMTPQLQAAVQGGADAVMVTGDLTFCTSFLQAYDTLELDLKKYVIATCLDPSVIKTVPGAFDGAFLTVGTDPEDDDVDVYAAIVDKYLPDQDVDPNPIISSGIASGVGTVVQFRLFMEGLSGDVTKEAVMNLMRTAKNVPAFMGGDATLTCDGTAIPLLPNVCGSAIQIATLDENGLPTEFQPIDPSALFSTG